jgi:hypothetical protein
MIEWLKIIAGSFARLKRCNPRSNLWHSRQGAVVRG